jgi:energy-coupling factor transporter ATP-binding protein EcfA2
MIEIRDLTFTYPGAAGPSLRDINLSVDEGEFILLLGPSGCGKSTLCLCLNGIIPHMLHGRMEGEVRINGRDTAGRAPHELASEVGLVFQNPDNQLFALTVEEDVAFGPENLGVARPSMVERVDRALAVTAMTPFARKFVYHLSGGQKQRTAVAGILAMNPGILVFDEPTADLDPRGTREVLETIHRISREEQRTVILVEHKAREALRYADRIFLMEKGRIVGDRRRGEPLPDDVFWDFHRPEPKGGDGAEQKGGPEALAMRGVSFRYIDGTQALKGVDLSVGVGEFVAVIGHNGSGKSTLAMLTNGLLNPSEGAVFIGGRDVASMKAKEIAHSVGYLFQNPDHQIFSDRVAREIAIGLEHAGCPKEEIGARVGGALVAVDLADYGDRDPNTLSRGERQRLAVASILAMEPEIFVFDEPTTGQDYRHIQAIMDFMVRLNRKGKTVVMITHDLGLASTYADRIVLMREGRIVGDIPAEDIPAYSGQLEEKMFPADARETGRS